jgi:hypothetical protein
VRSTSDSVPGLLSLTMNRVPDVVTSMQLGSGAGGHAAESTVVEVVDVVEVEDEDVLVVTIGQVKATLSTTQLGFDPVLHSS